MGTTLRIAENSFLEMLQWWRTHALDVWLKPDLQSKCQSRNSVLKSPLRNKVPEWEAWKVPDSVCSFVKNTALHSCPESIVFYGSVLAACSELQRARTILSKIKIKKFVTNVITLKNHFTAFTLSKIKKTANWHVVKKGSVMSLLYRARRNILNVYIVYCKGSTLLSANSLMNWELGCENFDTKLISDRCFVFQPVLWRTSQCCGCVIRIYLEKDWWKRLM